MQRGKVQILKDFYMPQLNRKRTLRIYLPPDYYNTDRCYPVLYMQDAQNLFSVEDSAFGTIWNIGSHLDELHQNNPKNDLIVVGIDNGEQYRYSEYSPWDSQIGAYYLPQAKSTGMPGGEGFQYMDFIVNTLKPYIDSHYRTLTNREHTGICGSSMGGLISICAGMVYQNVFSKIAAFSSAIYFAEEKVIDLIRSIGKTKSMRIYMDVGTNETSNPNIPDFPEVYVSCSKRTFECLSEVGFNEKELMLKIEHGGIHNEICWDKRFPDMLKWLF